MPIYSYKCIKCGEVFDKLVSPGSNGTAVCVRCRSDARRVFSPVGIIFKGSGFYSTDYKSGSSKGNSSRDKGSEKSREEPGKEPAGAAGDKSKGKKESGK